MKPQVCFYFCGNIPLQKTFKTLFTLTNPVNGFSHGQHTSSVLLVAYSCCWFWNQMDEPQLRFKGDKNSCSSLFSHMNELSFDNLRS